MLTLALLLHVIAGRSANWYFSASMGDDGRSVEDAHRAATPWRSIGKLNTEMSRFSPGDSIFFRCNDVFNGPLRVTTSGSPGHPIVFTCFGQGAPPLFSAFRVVAELSGTEHGIMRVNISGMKEVLNIVRINGVVTAMGRYPNRLPVATRIPAGDWSGGEIVIRKDRWEIDRHPLVAVRGDSVYYADAGVNIAKAASGFFIQNCAAALDVPGEWYFNTANQQLGVFAREESGTKPVIEISEDQQLLIAEGVSDLVFSWIHFTGANQHGIYLRRGQRICIRDCAISYSGVAGICARDCSGLEINRVKINASSNNACDINNTDHLLVSDCIITNTGMVAGSGQPGSGSYEALLLSGSNQTIIGNRIIGTGYIPITFDGSDIEIANNLLDSFGSVKDDGGGIYTWNNRKPVAVHHNRVISHNIILHALGAATGTDDKAGRMHGIYLDDNADHVQVTANTIAHGAAYGIYIHNANSIRIDSNLVFDNAVQLAMIHDEIAGPVYSMEIRNNTLVKKIPSQALILFHTKSVASPGATGDAGVIDHNRYIDPYVEVPDFGESTVHDMHASGSPVRLAAFSVTATKGNNLYAGGSFNNGLVNGYAWSPGNDAALDWVKDEHAPGGRLRLAFRPGASADCKATLVFRIGKVEKNREYLLRFAHSASRHIQLEAYLRQSGSPYTEISGRVVGMITRGEGSHEAIFLTSGFTEIDASLALDIPFQPDALYLDDLSVIEVRTADSDPEKWMLFESNPSPGLRIIKLNGKYVDTSGNPHVGMITLTPFTSILLLRKP